MIRAAQEQAAASLPRVWYLTDGFFPPIVGGLEKHAFQLSSRWIARGLPLTVITRKMEPDSPASELYGNVPITRIPPVGILKGKGWRAVLPMLSLLLRVTCRLFANAGSYEIILVSGVRILSIPAVVLSRLLGKRCVIKSESPIELWEDVSRQSRERMRIPGVGPLLRAYRGTRNAILRRADRLVAISAEIGRQYLEIGIDPARICPIPNGVNTDLFHPVPALEKKQLRWTLGFPPEAAVFIFSGRLARTKGVMTLARVWRRLTQSRPDIHLVIVGSGKSSVDDCEEELKEYVGSNRMEAQLTLTGEVHDVHRYLQAADVFVFPTDFEGFSLALVEAMICGLPAVCTRTGAACELIRDRQTGRLIEPKDAEDLQAALEWMLERRDGWPEMGKAAHDSTACLYSMDRVVNQYLELFASLAR